MLVGAARRDTPRLELITSLKMVASGGIVPSDRFTPMEPKNDRNTWRNIDGGLVCALSRVFGDLVLPKPDLSKLPPVEVHGPNSHPLILGSGVKPHLVLIDHVAQSSGLLYSNVSDHSVTLAVSDGSRNLMAHVTSFFSARALGQELERFMAVASAEGEPDYRVGLFVGRRAPRGAVRGVIGAIRGAGLGEFVAVKRDISGYYTVALEGEGQIVFAPLEAYADRSVGLYRRPSDGCDPFHGLGD